MLKNSLITLLTDFGLSDVYVGVMKGVIATINPALTIIDLTHQIPPQNIAAARFNLMSAFAYFPTETVHICVVDPGVGSQRRGIALQLNKGFLVGPDNGLFGGVLKHNSIIKAVELTNPQYWRTASPSQTFHGRDIFAAVGAHLASGVLIEKLGNIIEPESLVELIIEEPLQTENKIIGCIQYIDHFGNLITNIAADQVQGKNWSVVVGKRQILGSQTYSSCPTGEIVALIGSEGWVEIAVNGGSAQSQLQLYYGAKVEIILA
ncbi:MAG: SAM-dependent chlorinase/fluorinase [Coleofasciculaceae cyanobacterium]